MPHYYACGCWIDSNTGNIAEECEYHAKISKDLVAARDLLLQASEILWHANLDHVGDCNTPGCIGCDLNSRIDAALAKGDKT